MVGGERLGSARPNFAFSGGRRDGGGAGEDTRRLGRRIQWGKGAWTVVAATQMKIHGGCWLDALFCVPHIRHERMRFLVRAVIQHPLERVYGPSAFNKSRFLGTDVFYAVLEML
jgi:hypothetical protein